MNCPECSNDKFWKRSVQDVNYCKFCGMLVTITYSKDGSVETKIW